MKIVVIGAGGDVGLPWQMNSCVTENTKSFAWVAPPVTIRSTSPVTRA